MLRLDPPLIEIQIQKNYSIVLYWTQPFFMVFQSLKCGSIILEVQTTVHQLLMDDVQFATMTFVSRVTPWCVQNVYRKEYNSRILRFGFLDFWPSSIVFKKQVQLFGLVQICFNHGALAKFHDPSYPHQLKLIDLTCCVLEEV